MSDRTTVRFGPDSTTLVGVEAAGPPGSVLDAWRGAWSPTTGYAAGDIVQRSGSAWIAVESSTGTDPAVDVSTNPVASITYPSGQSFGSPDSGAMAFAVDRAMTVVALYTGDIGGNQSAATIGIASAVNAPGMQGGATWIGKGTPANGRVELDQRVDLSPGVTYWLACLHAPGFLIASVGSTPSVSHVAIVGQFACGTGGFSQGLLAHDYAFRFVAYGSAGSSWELFAGSG